MDDDWGYPYDETDTTPNIQIVDVLLKALGKNGIDIKEKKGSAEDMELLWLAEDYDQERALEVATGPLAFGIVQKGPALKRRYAVVCNFFVEYFAGYCVQ